MTKPITKDAAEILAEVEEAMEQFPEMAANPMALTPAMLKVLDDISLGRPVKNSPGVIMAARLRLEWTKPKPTTDGSGRQEIMVVRDPFPQGNQHGIGGQAPSATVEAEQAPIERERHLVAALCKRER